MTPSPIPAWHHRHWPLAALGALLALATLWAMLAPLGRAHHAVLLTFGAAPGQAVPSELALTLGVQDVLLLRNDSAATVNFGPLTLAPGRELRLPFERSVEQVFACAAAPGGRVRIRVAAAPLPGWQRLRWRWHQWGQALRHMPLRGPDT